MAKNQSPPLVFWGSYNTITLGINCKDTYCPLAYSGRDTTEQWLLGDLREEVWNI